MRLLNMTPLWNDTNELWTHSLGSVGYSDMITGRQPTCDGRVHYMSKVCWEGGGLMGGGAPSVTSRCNSDTCWFRPPHAHPRLSPRFLSRSSFCFRFDRLWLCHTFLFLLLSLIPLRVYVQIETADKNLRMETHLLCGAHPQLCQTATSENWVQQQFQLFKVCVWPSRSPSANDACADRGRSD